MIMIKILILEFLFIILLFLRELGVPRIIYEELYTNPKTRVLLSVFGDVLYIVGGSIIASVVYSYLTSGVILNIAALLVGISLTALGAYLRKD